MAPPRKKFFMKKTSAKKKKVVNAKQGPVSAVIPSQQPTSSKAKIPSPLDFDATPVVKEKSSVFSMRATKLFTPMEPEDKKAAAVEGRLQRAEKRRRINTNEDGDIVPAKNKKKAKKEVVEKPDVAKTVVEKPDTAKKEAVIVKQATTAVTNDKNKDKNGQKHKKLDLLKDRGAEKQPQNTESDSEEEDVSKKRAKFLEKTGIKLVSAAEIDRNAELNFQQKKNAASLKESESTKEKETSSSTTSSDDIYRPDFPHITHVTTTKNEIKLLTREELNTSAAEEAVKLKLKNDQERLKKMPNKVDEDNGDDTRKPSAIEVNVSAVFPTIKVYKGSKGKDKKALVDKRKSPQQRRRKNDKQEEPSFEDYDDEEDNLKLTMSDEEDDADITRQTLKPLKKKQKNGTRKNNRKTRGNQQNPENDEEAVAPKVLKTKTKNTASKIKPITGNTKKAIKLPAVRQPNPDELVKKKKKGKENDNEDDNEDLSNSSHIVLLSPQIEYRCEDCGRMFLYIKGLRRHIKSKHGEELLKYHCSECGAVLSRKDALDRHMRFKHPAIVNALDN